MHSNITSKLINLKDIKVTKINNCGGKVEIFIQTPASPHTCPVCSTSTAKIHDYRNQRIKDIPIQLSPTTLILRKRRYVCPSCNKRFFEKIDFLPRYHRTTTRFTAYIAQALKNVTSLKQVAAQLNTSPSTVASRFDLIQYGKPKLPQVLSIDEFKGNANHIKYQCILVDGLNKKVIDVLPDRKETVLVDYFKSFKDRDVVKYFVTDMWKPYVNIAKTFFKKALIIIDRFHYVRHNTWAFEAIRKREQARLGIKFKSLFKNSRKLLLSKPDKLKDDEKAQLNAILSYSEDLRQAYYLKQLFYEFSDSKTYELAKHNLKEFIIIAQNSGIKEYVNLSKTLVNWSEEILNSFKAPYSNGCTEGFNNKIKVIKRNAFGVRNFKRFRNRILHCCA